MIYLASPYSHPDPAVRLERYNQAARFTAQELWLGVPIFSPIVYAHHMAIAHNLPLDAEAWRPFNEWMISKSFEIWVLRIPGWAESIGVNLEIDLAHNMNLPVLFKDPHHA